MSNAAPSSLIAPSLAGQMPRRALASDDLPAALGPSTAQILGFGARLTLRPTLEIHGWRARVEIFASYDVTQGATGFIALVGRPPSAAPLPRTQ